MREATARAVLHVSGWIGYASVGLHTSVIAFAASDDYSFFSSYRAISDMGMSGEPHARAVNLLAFGATGLLLSICAGGWYIVFPRRSHVRYGSACLAGGGLCFTIAGVYPFPSTYHLVAVAGASLFLAAAIAAIGDALARSLNSTFLKWLSVLAVSAIIANLLVFRLYPRVLGHVSKTAFFLVIVWVSMVCAALLGPSAASLIRDEEGVVTIDT